MANVYYGNNSNMFNLPSADKLYGIGPATGGLGAIQQMYNLHEAQRAQEDKEMSMEEKAYDFQQKKANQPLEEAKRDYTIKALQAEQDMLPEKIADAQTKRKSNELKLDRDKAEAIGEMLGRQSELILSKGFSPLDSTTVKAMNEERRKLGIASLPDVPSANDLLTDVHQPYQAYLKAKMQPKMMLDEQRIQGKLEGIDATTQRMLEIARIKAEQSGQNTQTAADAKVQSARISAAPAMQRAQNTTAAPKYTSAKAAVASLQARGDPIPPDLQEQYAEEKVDELLKGNNPIADMLDRKLSEARKAARNANPPVDVGQVMAETERLFKLQYKAQIKQEMFTNEGKIKTQEPIKKEDDVMNREAEALPPPPKGAPEPGSKKPDNPNYYFGWDTKHKAWGWIKK